MAKKRRNKIIKSEVCVNTKRQERQAQRLGVNTLQSPENFNRRVYDIYKILTNSMTAEEKKNIQLIIKIGSRRKRLMIGSGLAQEEIKGLLDNYGSNFKFHIRNEFRLISQKKIKSARPFDWTDFGHLLHRNAEKERYENVVKKKRSSTK